MKDDNFYEEMAKKLLDDVLEERKNLRAENRTLRTELQELRVKFAALSERCAAAEKDPIAEKGF